MNTPNNNANLGLTGVGTKHSQAQPRQNMPQVLRQLLVVAAGNGNLNDVQNLLSRGAGDNGDALRAACEARSIPVVRELLNKISYSPYDDSYQEWVTCPYHTAVKFAISTGDIGFLRWVIEQNVMTQWEPAYPAMCDVTDFVLNGQFQIAAYFLGFGGYENGKIVPGKCALRVNDTDITILRTSAFDANLNRADRDAALRCLGMLYSAGRDFELSKHIVEAMNDLKRRMAAGPA